MSDNRSDFKQSVRAATLTNLTLVGLQTVDGVALAAQERVLVKNQTSPAENGLYTAEQGAWIRTADADTDNEVTAGMVVMPVEGSQARTEWILATPDPIDLGVTPLTFSKVVTDAAFEFDQNSASATWTVVHGLNKYPSVTVLDGSGDEVFADVHYTSTSQLEVLFGAPQTGKAILN